MRWPRIAAGNATIALFGASGVGKSTLINALVGSRAQATAAVREGDGRGRHTTVATELVRLPGGGWLIDTPGVRAVSLWSSGHGIERAFADVFELMDDCRSVTASTRTSQAARCRPRSPTAASIRCDWPA